MENFKTNDIQFEDVKLNSGVILLRNCYYDKQKKFAEFCKVIYNIRQYCKDNYFKAKNNVYYDFYSLLGEFGIGKSLAKYVCSCYERFVYDSALDDNAPVGFSRVVIKKEYEGYSSSKLFELLPLSEKMLTICLEKKIITSDMTVKEIRKKVKELSGKTTEDNQVTEDNSISEPEDQEEETVYAYDPDERHDLDYFKRFDKATLIDFLFMAEDYILNLKKKK